MNKTYELTISASVKAKDLKQALEKLALKLKNNKYVNFSNPEYNGAAKH